MLSGTMKLVGMTGVIVASCLTLAAAPIAESIFQKPQLTPLLFWVGASIFLLSLIQVVAFALQAKHYILTSSFAHNFLAPALFIAIVLGCHLSGVPLDAWRLTVIFAVALAVAFAVGCRLWFGDVRARAVPSARLDRKIKASIASMFVVVSMDMAVQWSGYLATGTFLSEGECRTVCGRPSDGHDHLASC